MTLDEIMEVLNNDNRLKMQVYQNIEKEFHREDIKGWLDTYNLDNNTHFEITEEDLNTLCNKYEKYLSNDESWSFCLDEVMLDFLKLKGE